jgi:uncharacterized protein (DUF2236 family)
VVSGNDLELALDQVRADAAGPVAGVFGPATVTWRIDREAVVFLGAGRALLLQLAHPWVAAAIRSAASIAPSISCLPWCSVRSTGPCCRPANCTGATA